MKNYVFIALSVALLAVMPARAEEPTAVGGEAAMVQTQPEIQVKGKTITVINATGEMFRVYDITGAEVYSARVESANKAFTIDLKHGCYIVKVGSTTRKITIQ